MTGIEGAAAGAAAVGAGSAAGSWPAPGRAPVARRRSWPDRSRPRISPNSLSMRAGSPRARSVSTMEFRHDAGRISRRERTLVEALRGREQSTAGHEVRIAGSTRHGRQPDIRPGARTGWDGGAGRHELDHAGTGVVRIRQTRDGDPVAGRRPADRDGGKASMPPSTSWTTRPSRAIEGSTAASDRPIATACHDHGARSELSARASIGSIVAASRPSVQAVPW